MAKTQVYINKKSNPSERELVEVEVLKDRGTTMLVKLPDGNKIVRKKARDLPKE